MQMEKETRLVLCFGITFGQRECLSEFTIYRSAERFKKDMVDLFTNKYFDDVMCSRLEEYQMKDAESFAERYLRDFHLLKKYYTDKYLDEIVTSYEYGVNNEAFTSEELETLKETYSFMYDFVVRFAKENFYNN